MSSNANNPSHRLIRIAEQLCDDTVDGSRLDQTESILKGPLPRCYREFLKAYNGGKPEPSKFSFALKNGEKTNSTVHYFFAIHNGRVGNLVRQFELSKGRIPAGSVPIATDPFGNLILIPMLDLPDVPVYFWDHEKELSVETSFDNVSLISESFEKFIQDLH